MYEANPGAINFGASLHEPGVIEGSSQQKSIYCGKKKGKKNVGFFFTFCLFHLIM